MDRISQQLVRVLTTVNICRGVIALYKTLKPAREETQKIESGPKFYLSKVSPVIDEELRKLFLEKCAKKNKKNENV